MFKFSRVQKGVITVVVYLVLVQLLHNVIADLTANTIIINGAKVLTLTTSFLMGLNINNMYKGTDL